MNNPYSNCLNEFKIQVVDLTEQTLFPIPKPPDFQSEDATVRFVGRQIYRCPKEEHIHEFIIDLLFRTLGDSWIKNQLKLPLSERHKIAQWENARQDFMKRAGKFGKKGFPSGYVKELMSLCADVYYLKLAGDIPKDVLNRLKNKDQFQGARYEIAVAAALVRTGFVIEWSTLPKNQKKPEFDAVHKYTGERIAIEVKSRSRSELKNEQLTNKLIEIGGTKLDILGLYNDAMKHNPKDKPFGLFIDINLPHHRAEHQWFWKDEVHEKLSQNGISFFRCPAPNFLAVTNSGWHYQKDKRAGVGEGLILGSEFKDIDFPFKDPITLLAVKKALNMFGTLPKDTFINIAELEEFVW